MKTLAEVMAVLLCLLFWTVVLPVAGLIEIGVLIADRVDGHAPHELVTHAAG